MASGLLFPTLVAEAPYPNVDVVGPVSPRTLKFGPNAGDGHRLQALDLPAGVALKMGVGRVVLTGQFIVAHPILQSQATHHATAAEFLQDAVNRDLIESAAGPDGRQNLPGPQGPGRRPQNLQDRQASPGEF
jgi:hypothetical protein